MFEPRDALLVVLGGLFGHAGLHELLPYIPGAAALVAVFWPKRNKNLNIGVEIQSLFHRIEKLESSLATAQADLAGAKVEIERLRLMEARLEEIVAHRDEEVSDLKTRLDTYRRRLHEAEDRIKSLEDWIRAQGVDPREIESRNF